MHLQPFLVNFNSSLLFSSSSLTFGKTFVSFTILWALSLVVSPSLTKLIAPTGHKLAQVWQPTRQLFGFTTFDFLVSKLNL